MTKTTIITAALAATMSTAATAMTTASSASPLPAAPAFPPIEFSASPSFGSSPSALPNPQGVDDFLYVLTGGIIVLTLLAIAAVVYKNRDKIAQCTTVFHRGNFNAAGATVYDGHAYVAMDQGATARAATTVVVEMTPTTPQ